MCDMDGLERLYAITALSFLTLLCVHFLVRGLRMDLVERYGWIVYALSVPAAAVSVTLLRGGKPWWLWLGGFLYLVWAAFGFAVEYVLRITDWRSSVRSPVFIPYVALYLATCMFYWWPFAQVCKPLWYVAAALFVLGTILNVRSH